MTRKEYNGWTNYETWVVNLWIDNDQGLECYWREQAAEAYESISTVSTGSPFTREERATLDLSDDLREHFENASQDLLGGAGQQSSLWADLLGAALSEVNWHEIAEHYIADLDKDDDETEVA